MRPKRKVDIKWTPEFAYAIGLLTADGCLSKDGRHIDFTSKDKELVLLFKKCLSLDNKIGTKHSGSNPKKDYFRVQFGDVVFYTWLESIGLMTNKSDKLCEVNVPDSYFADFVRGYFDGDGSFNSYWDERWRNSFMFYTKFSSTSKHFIEWLRATLEEKLDIKGSVDCLEPEEGKKCYILKYAKGDTRVLVRNMYYDAGLPWLRRKREKIDGILSRDN